MFTREYVTKEVLRRVPDIRPITTEIDTHVYGGSIMETREISLKWAVQVQRLKTDSWENDTNQFIAQLNYELYNKTKVRLARAIYELSMRTTYMDDPVIKELTSILEDI